MPQPTLTLSRIDCYQPVAVDRAECPKRSDGQPVVLLLDHASIPLTQFDPRVLLEIIRPSNTRTDSASM